MKLEMIVKYAFGKKRYYPCCEAGHLLLDMCKQKSFTWEDVGNLKRIGFEIENVTPIESI